MAAIRDTCPNCHGPAEPLPRLSDSAWVDYFRCVRCGEVWNVPKRKVTPVQVVCAGRAPETLNVSDPVVLEMFCQHCHGAVSLQFSDWHPENPPQRQFWWCPYCRKPHVAEFVGRLAWVTKGHEAEPTS